MALFIQAAQQDAGGGASSRTLAYGSNTTGASFLFTYCLLRGGTLISVTDTLNNNWIVVKSGFDSLLNVNYYILNVLVNKASGGANTATFHFSNSSNTFDLEAIVEYTGQNVANPVDVVSNFTYVGSNASTFTGSSIQTRYTNETVIGFGWTPATATVTGTNGFTARTQPAAGNFSLVDVSKAATGVYSPTASLSTTGASIDWFTMGLAGTNSIFQGGSWLQANRDFVNKRGIRGN